MAITKEISDIIYIHRNQPAIIDCFGPSGNKNRNYINSLQKSKRIIRFSCNDWWRHLPSSPPPNYWVLASSVDRIDTYQSQINRYKIPVLYAYSIDHSHKNIINSLDCEFILGYDQKHQDGNPNGDWCCSNGCKNNVVLGKLTIQQELKKICNIDEQYGSGDSVVFHMIAFAILMGCNPIYLNGVDLDYKKGYANNNIKPHTDNLWQECADRQKDNFSILLKSAHTLGSNIYNLNSNAWYGIFNTGTLKNINN